MLAGVGQLRCQNRVLAPQLLSSLFAHRSVLPRSAGLAQAPSRLRCVAAAAKVGTKGFGALTLGAPVVSPNGSEAMAAEAAKPCERLAALRAAMAAADQGRGVQAFLVPSEDPHMSEYSPEHYKRREFISKFTGTFGYCVITPTQALLWTDGRYFLQASQELGTEWTLMKAGMPGTPNMEDWLAANLPEGARVGIDPWIHTLDSVRRLQRKLVDSGKSLVPLQGQNLVDVAWGAEQAPLPTAPLRVHALEWAGEDVPTKLAKLRAQVLQAKAGALLVTALDEVAWLTNLRGSDVSFNPVFLGYALVTATPPPPTPADAPGATPAPPGGEAVLYVDPGKLTSSVTAHLEAAGVQVVPYDNLLQDLRGRVTAMAAAAGSDGAALWVDPAKVSYQVYLAAKEAGEEAGKARKRTRAEAENGSAPAAAAAAAKSGLRFVEVASPVEVAKAVKNPSELAGMREAHLRDAVAISEFLAWFEKEVAGGRVFTEVEVDRYLTARRQAQPGFVDLSFPTIAGANGNGAAIHYRAKEETCKTVDAQTLLLIDSGAQYDCGTTDITRTMHMGTPTDHQRRCYTRVLQGHIGLNQAVFPEGTVGAALDTLARMPLWSDGLNYRHGTGHGVGAALNVHEGPHSISLRYHITAPLMVSMIVSNEPGYYEEGGFGIRIENLEIIIEKDTKFRFGGVPYFGFDTLTLVPIQAKLMDPSLMSPAEIAWVDSYHAKVREHVAPRLQDKPEALQWLLDNTRPLKQQLGL